MTRIKVKSVGPPTADIMIVGEAPGKDEEQYGYPFVGYSGQLLDQMLLHVGIVRSECYITNVHKSRPANNDISTLFAKNKTQAKALGISPLNGKYPLPQLLESIEELKKEVEAVKPKLILALGNVPLWALTGKWGITNWRGSIIEQDSLTIIPTYHPAFILRAWDMKHICIRDLRRASDWIASKIKKLDYNFIVTPSFSTVIEHLTYLANKAPLRIAVDIETRQGHIACIGLAHSEVDAICIPLMSVNSEDGYWSEEEETTIIYLLREILTNPQVEIVGQNWLYDAQYIARFWGFIARLHLDTMIAHHALFCNLQKGLDFLSSIYNNYHLFWKSEGKEWQPHVMPEEQLWTYNCKDACITWSVSYAIEKAAESLGMQNVIRAQMDTFEPVLKMMLRGVRANKEIKDTLLTELQDQRVKRLEYLKYITGENVNVNSHLQVKTLLYDELGCKPIKTRNTKGVWLPSTNEEALKLVCRWNPVAAPICEAILDCRQLANSISVLNQPLDIDGRIRCSYNIAGTTHYRFSSSKSAFGSGMNLQNITKGSGNKGDNLYLPNLRELFIADPEYILIEVDYPQADARVVAWEANDTSLMDLLEDSTKDLHIENAKQIFDKEEPSKQERQLAKQCMHAANYGVSPRTLSREIGISTARAEQFLNRWFYLHPNITRWHEKIKDNLEVLKYIENKFGYRCYFFDRSGNVFKSALSWIPQSTVALATNLGIIGASKLPYVHCLLQTHDACLMQVRKDKLDEMKELIIHAFTITVPYERQLVLIPEAKVGPSWGSLN